MHGIAEEQHLNPHPLFIMALSKHQIDDGILVYSCSMACQQNQDSIPFAPSCASLRHSSGRGIITSTERLDWNGVARHDPFQCRSSLTSQFA
jgi:hypothetical protein